MLQQLCPVQTAYRPQHVFAHSKRLARVVCSLSQLQILDTSCADACFPLPGPTLFATTDMPTDAQAADADADVTSSSCQIVGITATLPNGNQVAKWLGAELYSSDHRPIPLRSFMLVSVSS